jgi:lipopolysaccharide export system protein LptA
MDLNASGEPSAAHLMGVVRFSNVADDRQEYGKSDEARIAFDAQGRPIHATMTGNVETDLSAGTNSRWMGADTLNLALAGGGKQPIVVRAAEATGQGGARMRMVDAVVRKDKTGKTTPGVRRTNLRADVLKAQFAQNGKQTELAGLDGTGRTLVEQILFDAANGVVGPQQWKETGTGDALRMDFKPGAKGGSELERAEQRGGVKIVREALPKQPGDPAEVEHAEGDDAVYTAAKDTMTMTGQVRVSDAASALFADRVSFDRATGDGTAEGSVRVSYLEPGSKQEPVHVSAARSVGRKATGITEFFAADGGAARMWQAGSQVEAPVLEFDRIQKTLRAHGRAGAGGQVVKTVLVDAEPPKPREGATAGSKQQRSSAPTRVLSDEAAYDDATRQIVFRGQVQVNDRDGVMRAPEATVFLAPRVSAAAAKDAPMSLGGKVERMVAEGGVEIEQPGRKATGERLVYTASDRLFVLTGTKTVPPTMVDEAQGTVTGAQMRFRGGEESVEVVGGDGADRVLTVAHVKRKE